MSQGSMPGKMVGICFMILWCSIAFGMGITALQWGAPFIFVLAPFGMGLFGVVFCIALARGGMPPMARTVRLRRYSDEYVTHTGDSFGREYTPPREKRKSIYQVPSVCPSCGAAISTESVDWVGPLEAQCPYCMATFDAEERTL